MTVLLKEVFDSVSNLPEALQDEIAKEILVDIRKKLKKFNDEKLPWEETYREMAAEKEDWNDFDIALMDGLQGEDFESQKI